VLLELLPVVVVAPPVPEVVDAPPVVVPVVLVPELLDAALVLLDAVVDVPLPVELEEDELVPVVELAVLDPVEDDAAAVVVLPLTVVLVADWPEEHAPTSNPATARVPTIRTCADAKEAPPLPRLRPTVIRIATPIETAQQ
jgi:hypothetical protein